MLTGVSHPQDPCQRSPGWTVTKGRPAGLPLLRQHRPRKALGVSH